MERRVATERTEISIDNIVIVVFAGEYDLACQKELRREFDRLHEQPNVVLDFSNVTYLDSTCIAELPTTKHEKSAVSPWRQSSCRLELASRAFSTWPV